MIELGSHERRPPGRAERLIASRARTRRMRSQVDERHGLFLGDPLADLMFTMIAVVLLWLIALLPKILASAPRPAPPPSPEAIVRNIQSVDGAPGFAIVATADQVYVPGGEAIALDDILENPRLRALLRSAREKHERVAEFIFADGSEAAFQLESVLAADAPQPIYEIRLASPAVRAGLR